MLVKGLIGKLEQYDPDLPVIIDDANVEFTETGGWKVSDVTDDGLGSVCITLGEEIDPL